MNSRSYIDEMISGFEEDERELSLKEQMEIEAYRKVKEKLGRFVDTKDPSKCKTCD
ncbi:MAG: hypothetical protein KatS3mg002_0303 [Candidatus Woesearchaeota archaeon]|nr:MAG: hypothetical protein KatS3mg002_0303 [Candidatus Woesearchaeota archaeon]